MDMGTGMAPDMEMPICTRTRDIHIRIPAGYTHTRVKHYRHKLENWTIFLERTNETTVLWPTNAEKELKSPKAFF